MSSSRNSIKLFVGGLPPTLTCAELAEVFAPHSKKMTIDLKMDPEQKLNRGFAFLYLNDQQLVDEITKRNYNVKNRYIQVQVSRATTKNFRPEGSRIFCRGIPSGTSDLELTEFFQQFSGCRCAYAIRDSSGDNKGFGFVELNSEHETQTLLSMKFVEFKGSSLSLESFQKSKTKNQTKEAPNSAKAQLSSGNPTKRKPADVHPAKVWNFTSFEHELFGLPSTLIGGESHLVMKPHFSGASNVARTTKNPMHESFVTFSNTTQFWESDSGHLFATNPGTFSSSLYQEGAHAALNTPVTLQSLQCEQNYLSAEAASRNMVCVDSGSDGPKPALHSISKRKDEKTFLLTRASTNVTSSLFAGITHRLDHAEANLHFRYGRPAPGSVRRYFTAN